MNAIINGINSIDNSMMDNNAFTRMVLSLPDLSEVFRRMDRNMISRVFDKVTHPDRLLSQLEAKVAINVLQNMDPNVYVVIWPHIPYTIKRLNLSQPKSPISSYPTMQKVIYSSPTDFPVSYADGLYGIDLITLHQVIRNYTNLPALLCRMKPETFNYVLSNAPFVTEYIVDMKAREQAIILSKMTYPCVYLQSINLEYAKKIIDNLPAYASCISLPETTVSTTTTTAPKPDTEPSTWEPIQAETVFTKEELEKMSEKVPNIGEILSKINPRKIGPMRIIFPNFLTLFNELDDEFINALNKVEFSKMTPKARSKLIWSLAGNNRAVEIFGTLMAPCYYCS
ncbi:hypothetical protein ACTXT7_004529 [Hymenolepis weldensis]